MSADSSCPSTQELEAFTEGRLTGGDLTRVLNHLTECLSCQDEFRRLSSKGDDSPKLASEAALGKLQGSTLGQYQLLEPVGGGGMGVVYKALHTRLKQVVALKTMTRAALADPQAQARFQREMAALGGLIHPNIVRATDAGEAEGWHYLVMEFVEGIDLNQLVKLCGPLRVSDACELIRQAANGLQFIHEHKRVHRDLKPSNLMLTLDGQIKILDLGLALLHEDHHEDQEELTSSRQVMGTADFMAPEQARSAHDVDIRADLYSLGCTLYKLLTGVAPFNRAGLQRAGKLRAHAEMPPPAIGDFRTDVPNELAAIVKQLLAKDPAKRYQQPSELVTALTGSTSGHDLVALAQTGYARRAKLGEDDAGHRKETVPFHLGAQQLLADRSTPTPTAPESNRPASRPRRKLTSALAILALALCLAGVAVAWWLSRPEELDDLPWPPGYPAELKCIAKTSDMSQVKPVELVRKRAWRPYEPDDRFRGNHSDGGKTMQPLWRHRLVGRGLYYEANNEIQLYAHAPPSLTFMELSRNLRRHSLEAEIELMSLPASDWVGGAYVGWQERSAGSAKTYLMFLERGEPRNVLHVAPVEVTWKQREDPLPVYPFVPIAGHKVLRLDAPPLEPFNRIRVQANLMNVQVQVIGGGKGTLAAPYDPRGSLGLWVQKGSASCGRVQLWYSTYEPH